MAYRVPEAQLTRLGRFIRHSRIRMVDIADLAGISRQHLIRLSIKGRGEPTRPVIVWVTLAIRRLSPVRVRMTDLFDFEGAET